jgi:hypothetical protein
MQRSKALRAIRGPTPYPYFLELPDMAKSLQMRMRLNSASNPAGITDIELVALPGSHRFIRERARW